MVDYLMVDYLFDTNIIINYGRGHQPTIDFLYEQLNKQGSTYISTIIEAEIYAGKSFGILDRFLREEFPAESISVNSAIARLAGTLRRRQHTTDIIDALIAATVLTHDLTLITKNTKHFQNIPSLKNLSPE